ncbi:hypothetical protein V6N12_024715 [Hibiscus sabdariffa]|uniref:Annexin n=1 Tax=Hibiscus sabdariffa TaxID=183260 RepID=A0ABR2BFA5_9ROSI
MATIAVPNQVSIAADAEALYKACKGWGTDEKAIIQVLGRRNEGQRRLIRFAYQGLYKEDLVRRLDKELTESSVSLDIGSGRSRCSVSPFGAKEIERPTPGAGRNLVHQILRGALVYKKSLSRSLLIGLVSAIRYEGEEINKTLAKSEAKVLHEAIKDKELNNDEVIRILTTRSKLQLQLIFNVYREEQGTSITKVPESFQYLSENKLCILDQPFLFLQNLPNKSKDEFLATLRITVRCLKDLKKYFEKVLRNSMQRLGTDEDALTRVIVTRAEKDLKEIKELYYKRNSVRLDEAVDKDTRGDYKDMLLTLLGNEV